MSQRARDHHYAPEAYLRGWSEDGHKVWAYETLVADARYPEWNLRAVRGIGYHEDLYTTTASGEESDRFERWLGAEIERPAAEAIALVREDRRLTSAHWHALAVYAAALDLRTPASYVEQKARWDAQLPGILGAVMSGLEEKLKAAQPIGAREAPPLADPDAHPFPVKVTVERGSPGEKARLRAEVTAGRDLWLHQMKHQLTHTAKVLTRHRWVILHPQPGHEWITSDHPVLRLNYYGPDHDPPYDFLGGWGRERGEILLPLSPQHLMYTMIGRPYSGPRTLNGEMTLTFQRLFAERAHRWILALNPLAEVSIWRRRTVDPELWQHEREAWRKWNEIHRDPATGTLGGPES